MIARCIETLEAARKDVEAEHSKEAADQIGAAIAALRKQLPA